MKISFLISCAIFLSSVLANAEAMPQWAGEWKGKKGCILQATITESEVYKRRYLFRMKMFKNAEDVRDNNPSRDFYTHSELADSVEEAIAKSVTSRTKAKCDKKGKCEEYWTGDDEGSHPVPAEAFLKFDKDLVLTSIRISKGLGIPFSKKCEELKKME